VTSLVSVEVEFDLFLNISSFVEESKGDFSLTNVDTLVASVDVEDLNVELVWDQVMMDDEVLSLPGWVLATVFVDSGGPFLVTASEVDHWVHLVEETAFVVFEVS
jgi:hypothetical protein